MYIRSDTLTNNAHNILINNTIFLKQIILILSFFVRLAYFLKIVNLVFDLRIVAS